MSEQFLNINGLSAAVDGNEILHKIDLQVAAGETHVIMGPNGAGKSSLAGSSWGTRTMRSPGGRSNLREKTLMSLR